MKKVKRKNKNKKVILQSLNGDCRYHTWKTGDVKLKLRKYNFVTRKHEEFIECK